MSLYLNPRYGFTAITAMSHDEADVIVSKVNAFLAKKKDSSNPVVVLGFDSLNDNNVLYIGFDLGYSTCIPGYSHIDLSKMTDAFAGVEAHVTFLYQQFGEVLDQVFSLKDLDWSIAPRKFFSTHS